VISGSRLPTLVLVSMYLGTQRARLEAWRVTSGRIMRTGKFALRGDLRAIGLATPA
jgi:hypothetical protein